MFSGPARILIVDDEPQICDCIRDELLVRGFHCTISTQGEEARNILREQAFDVVIADVTLPGINGLDLLSCAKGISSSCKVILITGSPKREYLAQAILSGAYEYMEKPFRSKELFEVVSRAVTDFSPETPLIARAADAMETSEKTRQASLDSVRALVRAVEAKDPYTRRHSEQVAHYAVNLSAAMNLTPAMIETIRVASLLHDIGKIGVPDHILLKPGPLTPEEFENIRRHPALGADILSNISLFNREANLVRHHHETWDGTGYPDGLAAEEAPLGSRIIHMADAMDAMLMERTYKRGYHVQKMLDEIIRCSGSQFDPRIAATALQWCRTNPEKLIVSGKQAPAVA
jgi:putative nucleotidyltransferase with HDIG domain